MAKENCDDCGMPIMDEDVFRHQGKKYCPKCVAEHIKEEHLGSPEAKKLTTFRTT
jgi:uncharacterized Zn finger protein (UPF0148 family)